MSLTSRLRRTPRQAPPRRWRYSAPRTAVPAAVVAPALHKVQSEVPALNAARTPRLVLLPGRISFQLPPCGCPPPGCRRPRGSRRWSSSAGPPAASRVGLARWHRSITVAQRRRHSRLKVPGSGMADLREQRKIIET